MSLIDDLVKLLRLRVQVYHNSRVCGDWQLAAGASTRACFHMPSQGDCKLHVPGEGDWLLAEGDVAIFPRELTHSMTPSQPLSGPQQNLPIADSQSIEGTSMLCGTIHFYHGGGEQLMDLLPKVTVISAEKTRRWLAPITELIVNESLANNEMDNPILNRLCEVLVAYTLRCYCENNSHENGGLFAVYTHPKLHKAVTAIHKNPAYDWQLASMAHEAEMSRTRFSELFSKVASMTATQYLTWWRMQVAYAELTQGHSVGYVADYVGYGSEAAFARVFKKVFNKTVGVVRSEAIA